MNLITKQKETGNFEYLFKLLSSLLYYKSVKQQNTVSKMFNFTFTCFRQFNIVFFNNEKFEIRLWLVLKYYFGLFLIVSINVNFYLLYNDITLL